MPGTSGAASVAELSASARQAQSRMRELKGRGQWGVAEQQKIIGELGRLAMDFLTTTDLAVMVADPGQQAAVRSLHDNLSDPLEEIYNTNFSLLDSMSKAVMDQDGDLEALYETQQWKDTQLLASQSLYFLNWLRYVGAFLYGGEKKRQLLEKAANGFSEFAVGEQTSALKRESLFGRSLCEKELQQYDWAIRDFQLLLNDQGTPLEMAKKARLSLLETYVQAEKMQEALAESDRFLARMGSVAQPGEMARARYLRAQALFDLVKREKGAIKEQHRKEALSLIEQLRRQGGFWQKQAEALAKGEIKQPEEWFVAEETSSFVQWEQAKVLIQEGKYQQAIPLLEEILASTDPAAKEHQREARYFLGVGMFQQRNYREAASHLAAFLNAEDKPHKFGPDAAYLRFKAAEALYAKASNPENTQLYLDAIRDYTRRYPGHRSVFEAHFRLGEYYQGQNEFLPAIEAYGQVAQDPAFRLRADFATLQCYFSLLEALPEEKDHTPLSEPELHQRIAAGLERFWRDAAGFEKESPTAISRVPLQDYRGKVSVMHAVFLSQNGQQKEGEIVSLLLDFEEKYPKQKEAFFKVAQMRLGALIKLGRLEEAEKDIEAALRRFNQKEQKQLLDSLPERLLREARKREAQGDMAGTIAAKRATVRIYESRLHWQRDGEEPPSNQFKYQLAQLYLDVGEDDKALPLFEELQQGAYSLVALAGLGTIAERKRDYQTALGYWGRMLKDTQVGDPLWFRGTYELARLYHTLGSTDQACKIIGSARTMLPRLGDEKLKKQIQEQVTQSCGK